MKLVDLEAMINLVRRRELGFPTTLPEFSSDFWSRVAVGGLDECWEWIGAIRRDGLPYICLARKHLIAYRVAYVLVFGEVHDALEVCHRCDNGNCINPCHWFEGTQTDNMLDCFVKGRNNRGEDQPMAKLNCDAVRFIRSSTGQSDQQLAEMFGVCRQAVQFARTRKTWRCVL